MKTIEERKQEWKDQCSKIHETMVVYKCEFSDGCYYYGITHNLKKRKKGHLKKDKGVIYDHSQRLNEKPIFKLLTNEPIPTKQAVMMEKELIDESWDDPKLLNIQRGGSTGGNSIIYSYDDLFFDAIKYRSINEWRANSVNMYEVAKDRGREYFDRLCNDVGWVKFDTHTMSYDERYKHIQQLMIEFSIKTTSDLKKICETSYNFVKRNKLYETFGLKKIGPTTMLGKRSPTAKLTDDEVRHIRRLYKDGVSKNQLTKDFDINNRNLSYLLERKTYKDVE